jgi:hypothetical protein
MFNGFTVEGELILCTYGMSGFKLHYDFHSGNRAWMQTANYEAINAKSTEWPGLEMVHFCDHSQLANSMEQSSSWEANVHSVKKFPAFYGTLKFITMFTRAYYWSLSWARWIQSTPSKPVNLRSNLKALCNIGNMLVFYSGELSAPLLNLQAGGPPLLAVPNIFAATLHIWRPSPP